MLAVVRSVLDDPRPPGARAGLGRDWALLGALVIALGVELLVRDDLTDPVVPAVLTLVTLPVVLVRRTRPLLAIVVALAAGLVLEVLASAGVPDEPATLNTAAFALLLVYALGRWGSGREIVLGVALAVAQIVLTFAVGRASPADAIGGAAVLSAAVSVGVARRVSVRSRDRDLERVRSLERGRLARELHDIVAHRVTAIAIRAQAGLAASGGTQGPAVDALHDVEQEAAAALTEMRSVVRSLREDEAAPELAPTPTVGDLRDLARVVGTPTVEVELDAGVGELSGPVASAVLRLARESVTNARRHARGATSVRVRLSGEQDSVRLTVHDDGAAAPAGGRGDGFGLAGMRERAYLLGGRCDAGPDPHGGWTVTAVLPRDPRRPLEPAR